MRPGYAPMALPAHPLSAGCSYSWPAVAPHMHGKHGVDTRGTRGTHSVDTRGTHSVHTRGKDTWLRPTHIQGLGFRQGQPYSPARHLNTQVRHAQRAGAHSSATLSSAWKWGAISVGARTDIPHTSTSG